MPDGRKITIGAERFKCPEAIFEPTLAYQEFDGVQKYCVNAV